MKEECKTWLTTFFEDRHKMSRPDGRALFRYRTTEQEFIQVEGLLQSWLAAYSTDDNLSRLADDRLFCRLFVLYASEWWRRYYDGSGMAWEPILAGLKANPYAWNPQQRSGCVQTGLDGWKVRLRQFGGYQYILNIALQGGLPLQLLSEGRGRLGKLLKRVLHLAGQSTSDIQGNAAVSEQDIYGWVESLKGMLPRSYHQREIFILLSDIVVTVLDLKLKANLTSSADAIERLNRHVPDWRERFSLPLEDGHAQGVIAQLLQDAAEVSIRKASAPFPLERSLEKDEQGRRLCSTLQLPNAIDIKKITDFFALPDEAMPRHANLILKAGEKNHAITLRRMAGHNKYRVMSQFPDLLDDNAIEDHVLELGFADGRRWRSLVHRGEELDEELPWIFSAGSDSLLLKQGSDKIAETKALVLIPEHWEMAADGDNGECTRQGELAIFSRTIWYIHGQATATNDRGEHFRFKTGRADAAETSFIWKGNEAWYDFQSPTRAFKGEPKLSKINSEGFSKAVNASPDFQSMGNSGLDIPIGPVIGKYPPTGEPQCRTRMVLLPEKATVDMESHDSRSGSIHLKHWGISHAHLLTPEIQMTVEKQQPNLILHLSVDSEERTPEQVALEVFWPHTTIPVRLSLPYPALGARAFSITGEELKSGTDISVQKLLGTRVVIHSTQYNAKVELVLHSDTDNTDRSFTIRRTDQAMQMTVRLQDYEEEIRQMFTMNDKQDSHISIRVILNGTRIFLLQVRRYEGALEPEQDRSSVCLDASMLNALDPKTVGEIRIQACNMIQENERIVELSQLHSEGVPVGRWPFTAENPTPGPWLLFPHRDTPMTIRPIMMNVFGEVHGDTFLTQAMNYKSYHERKKSLLNALQALTDDYLHEGWDEVEMWAEQIGHLSLTAFDLWRSFALSSSSMASLAFRLGGISHDFVRQFAIELPFSWEAVTYSDWNKAIRNLYSQCEHRFEPEILQTVFHSRLKSIIEKLIDDTSALQYILGIASASFVEGAHQEIVGLQHGIGPGAANDLFTGDSCLLQKLFHRHGDDKWPDDFRTVMSGAKKHPVYSRYLCSKSYDHRDLVINLPLLLAAQCAVGETDKWLTELHYIRTLSACKAFDPEWFSEAYNLTIARCLADNVIQP